MINHKYISGDKVWVKGVVPGYYYGCKKCKKRAMEHKGWYKELEELAREITEDEESCLCSEEQPEEK